MKELDEIPKQSQKPSQKDAEEKNTMSADGNMHEFKIKIHGMQGFKPLESQVGSRYLQLYFLLEFFIFFYLRFVIYVIHRKLM